MVSGKTVLIIITSTKKMETFYRDLARGKQLENIVLDSIREKYPKSYIEDGYFKEWDIFIPELNIGVEVKSDEKSKYTGNIVIEVEFNGKPSALSTTKAEYWVIYDGYGFNWFKTSNIRRCIEESNQKLVRFIGKGDTKPKLAYLITKKLLYKYGERNRPPREI